MRQKFNKNKNH